MRLKVQRQPVPMLSLNETFFSNKAITLLNLYDRDQVPAFTLAES